MFIEATADIGARITNAIRQAARATGAGFEYLLKTALRESNFDPNAKASTSSATGLFQFIDQTWLTTLKEAGASYGYGRYADAITKTPSGRYVVADPGMYREIMSLRADPTANALMAGAFTRRNGAELSEGIGRKPTDGELYIAHFLGASGAIRFINAAERKPQARAVDLFPEAAQANRSIFYNRRGEPRSVAQVYALLVAKHNVAGAQPAVQAAQAAPFPLAPPANAEVLDQQTGPINAYAPPPGPVFHSLFRSEGRGPVSQGVSALWGVSSPTNGTQIAAAISPPSASPASDGPPGGSGKPLDLFQFLRPEIRNLARRT
jgi:hypothetical protein